MKDTITLLVDRGPEYPPASAEVTRRDIREHDRLLAFMLIRKDWRTGLYMGLGRRWRR